MSKIDEFKKKYKIQSVEEEEEQKASSSPIEEFKKKYNITTTDESDKLGSYERSKRESKTSQVISSNFDRMGSSAGIDGYKKYLEDEEAKKTAPKYDLNNDGQDAWWEKALGYLGGGGGGVVDTTLPTAGVTQAVHDLREDESYKRPSKDWSVKQKSEFGELYLTSPESAFAYAEKTNKQNNKRKEESEIDKIQREATKNFGYGVGHTVGAIATAPLGMADYLGDLAYAAAGRDIAPDGSVSPFEYSQAVTGGISEHLNEEVGTLPEDWWMVGGKGLGDLYGLGTSIAQSMASAYTLGGVGTLVSYFGQAAAAGVDDAIARGASDDQALIYGAALGTFEGVAEMVGIDNLFKLGSASTVKGLIKNVIKQAGAEGGEELFTAITSEIADRLIMQDKSNFNILVEELMAQGMSEADAKKKAWMSTLGDIAFDTIAGAVSGSVSGGIHSGVQTAITNADAKANYSGQAQDMVSEALASEDANTRTVGEKYQKKLNDNKKLSGWNINHLLETTDTQKVKSAVEAQLTKLGESGDVSTLAEVITKQTQGIELSKKEQAIIDGSKFGQRVVNTLKRENIKSGEYDTRWAKDIGTRRLNADVYNKSLSDHISDAVDAERKARLELREMDSVTENATSEENAVESEISAPVEGVKSVAKAKMTDAEGNETPVKVAKIVDVENGEASLELEGGETVKASDVDFGDSGIGFVYQAATEMVSGVGGFNVDAANLMVKAVNPNISEAAASLYVAGFNEAYRYGAMGYPVSALASGGVTSKLSEKQRERAYNLGKIYGEGKVAEKQAKIDSILTKKDENISKTDSKEKKGKVYFDVSAVGKNLTERQRASLKGLRVVAEAMGIDIHIFESKLVDGRRVGKNGSYYPSTKTIEIDLYAGVDGNGLMLFTASHELTHHIKEVAPAKFKVFADALLDEFTKNGKSIDELISRKLETLEANGRLEGLSQEQAYDLAYEEVVADAAESMLVDSNALEALSRKLRAKDKSLWETIKDFIAKLVNRIKAAYEGLDPDSHEGKLVREMKDSAERLRQLWVDALLEASDMVEIDTNTESVAPMLSERTWTESEYVTHRDQMAEKIAKALDVSLQKAKSYIDDINSIAKMIAEDRVRLDYEASSFGSAFVSNVEYGGSFDYTTLCKKRRIYTGTFTEIQKRLKDVALTPDDILKIRNLMIEEGIEATCGLCYVEGSRANMGKFAKKFIELYKRDNPDAWIPNMADVNTPDGVEKMRINHPEAYERYEYFWNHYGKLKESDPALFASQQKPKLYEARKEYKGEILEHFKGDSTVAKKNLNGGIRMQSFSDFEIVHLIDTMQVIMDMSTIGLAGQAYTKVPEFAKAFGNTGLKINLSLIAKGVDADGNLIFDDREGMPHDTAFELRTKYSKNVGTIIVTFTDEQLLAAMADPRIDFIIPFHRSQWKKGQYGAMGLPKGTKDYTFMQNEKLIKQTYHEYQGRMVKDKASNYMPNEYWDFSKSGKENAEAYLKMCAENNKRPKFYKLLAYDGNGTYSLKADGSTDGYWKLLIDFKMYDNEGIGSPQMAVTPTFNMDEARTMLDEYKGGHSEYPVANGVVDKFVSEYNKENKTKYSDRDSEGNELSEEQAEFFKDSKVRDKKGNLMVLYHGTTANFNTFKKGDVGFHFGTKGAARGRVGFGKNVTLKEVYLNITNPIVFDEDLGSWDADFRLTRELYDMGILTQADAESVLFTDDRRYRRTTEAANKKLASVLLEKGYDGIAYSNTFETKNPTTSYIVFNSNQAKETTNKAPTSNPDIRFQDRDPDSYSNRSLLVGALESAVQNDIEREKLKQYKEKIDLLNAEEQKLHDLRAQIKELSFAKGTRDTEAIKKLQLEANQAANRVNIYDRQLLNLESTKALKGVLEREKAQARKKAEQKGKEALERQREKSAKTQRELMDRYQESRKRGVESRNKTAMRHKIQKTLKRLNKLFKGSKERNVKEDMKDTVATALALGEILFNNEISNRDIVRLGVESVTENESKLLNEYHDLLIKKEANDERIESIRKGEIKPTSRPYLSEVEEHNRKIEARIAKLNKELSDVFARERARLTRTSVSTLIYNLATEYHSLQESKVDYIKKAYSADLFTKLIDLKKEMDGVTARDMSMSQLEKVDKVFTMLEHSIRTANQYFRDGKFEDLETSASTIMGEIDRLKDTKQISPELASKAKSFLWNELTPYHAFDKIGSETLMKYFVDLLKGQGVAARDAKEARLFAAATREKYGYGKWKLDEVYNFKLKDGRTFSTTLKHLLSVYAYSKREQAEDHMKVGGFFHNDKATFRKEKGVLKMVRTDAVGYKVDADILEEIKKALGKEKMSYVDEMLDYLTKMGEKGNEVTRVMWGVDIFTEKVYFPLKSKDDFLKKSTETAQAVSLKNDGMTKETKPGASNPIVLEAFDDVWANHVERMSQYHGMVIPIDNLNKVLHYGKWADTDSLSVSTKLEGKFTSAATDYLEQLINDLNGGVVSKGATNPFWGFFGKWKKTKVGASLSTVVQQPTAILRAMAEIDAKYFVDKPNLSKLSEQVEEMQTYAPIAIIKEIGGFDAGAGKQMARWINSDTLTGIDKVSDTIDNISMKGAEIADQIGWVAIWEAVKRETKATTDLEYGSEEFLKKCGERAEEVINKTQVYDSVLSRSGFMRSKNDSVKMLTSFMGEPTLSMNMLYSAVINAKRGGKGAKAKAARTIGCVYASIILAEALAAAIYALRDDDEDESYLEKYLQALGEGVLTDIVFAPVTSLPGVKDVVSIFQGWNVDRSDMAIFADIKNAFDGLDSEKKSPYRKIEDFSGAIAAAFGLPLKNVLRTGREIYNVVENIVDGIIGTNDTNPLLEGITGKESSKSSELYNAIVNGDNARLEVYKKGYKTTDSYTSAIRKALRENDPRIKEAAEAKLNGDSAKSTRIAEEIEREGYFLKEDIKAAINSEINELKEDDDTSKDEATEDKDEAISWYDASDINVAFESGDTALAKEIIQDLIDTKVANGMDEKKAKSSLRSSMTSYWKPLYKMANQAEKTRIRKILYNSGLYGTVNDVVKTAQDWLKD